MSMAALPEHVRHLLDRYRRRRRVVRATTGLLAALAVTWAAVGLAVLLDRRFRGLSSGMRAGLLFVICAAFAALMIRGFVWPILRRMGDRRVASRLGDRFPDVAEDLYTAVELTDRDEPGISRSLLASALDKISERAHVVDHRRAVPLRALAEFGTAFLVVAVGFAAAYVAAPEAVGNALHRLFRPDRDVSFLSYTKLSVRPGDKVIRKGDAVAVAVRTSGRVASWARIEAVPASGDTIEVVVPTPEGRGTWRSRALFDDLRYRVTAGDAESRPYCVRVVPAPSLSGKSAELRLPKYAGSRELTVDGLNGALEIVEGALIRIRARPADRGSAKEFRCRAVLIRREQGKDASGPAELVFEERSDGGLETAFFGLKGEALYEIALTDGFGLRSRAGDTVAIKAGPDRIPRVVCSRPGRDVMILPNERIRLEVTAEDDLGMRGLGVMWRTVSGRPGEAKKGEWKKEEVAGGGIDKTALKGSMDFTPSELGLSAGDSIEYKGVASDYADDRALRRGYSPVYRIGVMSETEHLEMILQRLKDLQVDLMRTAARQKIEAGRTGDMSEAAKREDVGEEARRARDRERGLARTTENLARRLERTIPELIRNPSTPLKMLAGLERLSRNVRSVANEPMAKASEDLGKAANAGQKGRQNEQGKHLQQAKGGQERAAEELQRLARMLNRLRRRSVLVKLAEEAERLAALQREVRRTTQTTAMATAGRTRADLPREAAGALARVARRQRTIRGDVATLDKDIGKAAQSLAFSSPREAGIAEEAATKMEKDNVLAKAADVSRELDKNVLFSQLKRQDEVASGLAAVAEILRRSTDDSMDSVAKALEEFIRRQRELNREMGGRARKEAGAPKPMALGEKQSHLEQDVSEQASALHWLAREMRMFESDTARKLDAAAGEMRSAVDYLFATATAKGLRHGEKALKLLEGAREKFSEERQQMQQQQQQQNRNMEAMLLLYRMRLRQKRINQRTKVADRIRANAPRSFARRTASLSKRQSQVRQDARKLQEMLRRSPRAAAYISMAGAKMDLSRVALAAADTGRRARVVQSQITAMLEKLLESQQGAMGGMSAARMRAMMQMMGRGGGGGYEGGENAPIMPATLEETREDHWTKMRARYKGRLGAGFEGAFPVEFRGLLNAYFDELRKESVK